MSNTTEQISSSLISITKGRDRRRSIERLVNETIQTILASACLMVQCKSISCYSLEIMVICIFTTDVAFPFEDSQCTNPVCID